MQKFKGKMQSILFIWLAKSEIWHEAIYWLRIDCWNVLIWNAKRHFSISSHRSRRLNANCSIVVRIFHLENRDNESKIVFVKLFQSYLRRNLCTLRKSSSYSYLSSHLSMISVCLIIRSCWAISLLDQENRVSIHPLHPKKGDAHTKPNSSYHFTCVWWVICNCQLMRTWVVALENYACFSRLLLATWIITYMRFNKCKYWHAFERQRVTARRTESGKARLPIHALLI